jgi:cation transport ATPase
MGSTLAPIMASQEDEMDKESPERASESGPIGEAVVRVVVVLILLFAAWFFGALIGALLQSVFEPILGSSAQAFVFATPVLIVAAWVYARYYTAKGLGTLRGRRVALVILGGFALLMAGGFVAEQTPSSPDSRRDAEVLARDCSGHWTSRLTCVTNKITIVRRQEGGR